MTSAHHTGSSKWISVRLILLLAISIAWWQSSVVFSQAPGVGGKRSIDIASINLYVGSDFSPVTTLDPSDPNFNLKLISGVATIYSHIVATDFRTRADALAREIVERAPDLIGLQEAALLRRQSPGDSIVGGTTPATKVELDYVAILLDALARRGAHYAVAAQIQNVDVELPLVTPNSFDDLRFTDRDVVLVRTDLPPGQFRVLTSQGKNFTAFVPLPVGVKVLRGWTSVDVQVRGRSFRFVNTHLEDRLPPQLPNIQQFQALELLADPLNTTMPVILAGDFNADANGKYSPEIYGLLISQGRLTDAWNVVHPGNPGLTWGHDELLSNPALAFLYRLDLALYRGSQFQAIHAETVDPIIGVKPPLWFSDHAGLFATLAVN